MPEGNSSPAPPLRGNGCRVTMRRGPGTRTARPPLTTKLWPGSSLGLGLRPLAEGNTTPEGGDRGGGLPPRAGVGGAELDSARLIVCSTRRELSDCCAARRRAMKPSTDATAAKPAMPAPPVINAPAALCQEARSSGMAAERKPVELPAERKMTVLPWKPSGAAACDPLDGSPP